MFTAKSCSLGLGSVVILFVLMFLFKAFSQVGGDKTSGPAVLSADIVWVITSFAFWLLAVVILFATVDLSAHKSVTA